MRPMLPLLAALTLACAAPEAAQTDGKMSSPATDTARPAPGQPAPDFSAASTSGGELGLSSYKGKQTLVLAFFPKAFTGG
jgi:thioredoxin-dependent peroxiredoxin